jgi:hypothetical protein
MLVDLYLGLFISMLCFVVANTIIFAMNMSEMRSLSDILFYLLQGYLVSFTVKSTRAHVLLRYICEVVHGC